MTVPMLTERMLGNSQIANHIVYGSPMIQDPQRRSPGEVLLWE